MGLQSNQQIIAIQCIAIQNIASNLLIFGTKVGSRSLIASCNPSPPRPTALPHGALFIFDEILKVIVY